MNEIAFDKFMRGCGWVVSAIFAGLGSLWLYDSWSMGKFKSILSGHDSRLLGVWQGTTWPAKNFGKHLTLYTFQADASGHVDDGSMHLPFRWGTEANSLQMKYMDGDAWDTPKFKYSPSTDRSRLSLDRKNHYLFPPELTRVR